MEAWQTLSHALRVQRPLALNHDSQQSLGEEGPILFEDPCSLGPPSYACGGEASRRRHRPAHLRGLQLQSSCRRIWTFLAVFVAFRFNTSGLLRSMVQSTPSTCLRGCCDGWLQSQMWTRDLKTCCCKPSTNPNPFPPTPEILEPDEKKYHTSPERQARLSTNQAA